jgi:hypothetical protein
MSSAASGLDVSLWFHQPSLCSQILNLAKSRQSRHQICLCDRF